jgi:peptidoglycan/LPS O-acetylase OafA/YrhL
MHDTLKTWFCSILSSTYNTPTGLKLQRLRGPIISLVAELFRSNGLCLIRVRDEDWIMSLGTILIIVLILLLLGVFPSWRHSANWGYGPSGIVGTILIVVLILLLLGRI